MEPPCCIGEQAQQRGRIESERALRYAGDRGHLIDSVRIEGPHLTQHRSELASLDIAGSGWSGGNAADSPFGPAVACDAVESLKNQSSIGGSRVVGGDRGYPVAHAELHEPGNRILRTYSLHSIADFKLWSKSILLRNSCREEGEDVAGNLRRDPVSQGDQAPEHGIVLPRVVGAKNRSRVQLEVIQLIENRSPVENPLVAARLSGRAAPIARIMAEGVRQIDRPSRPSGENPGNAVFAAILVASNAR